MATKLLCAIILCIFVSISNARQRDTRMDTEDDRRDTYQKHHSKRHMVSSDHNIRRRIASTPHQRMPSRKKPSGHLTPLDEDDIDDDLMSVAIGPPSMRPKYAYEKPIRKQSPTVTTAATVNQTKTSPAVSLVKDVLSELSKDFLMRQVNEDFVFGQYVGNAMRNLTSELRIHMQHEILDLIMKYQALNKGEKIDLKLDNIGKLEKRGNDTDENWPDFTHLAKIIG